VCLALFGLKSCTHDHPEMSALLTSLRRKVHNVYAKPTQPWADYERMLPHRHAGMLSDVLQHNSNPAFSMHALATGLEGLRRLSVNLCRDARLRTDTRSGPGAHTLAKVQHLQATLLTKLQYTDAPLNLTHLALFLNSLR
jgi:hypothetical protein